MKYWQSLLLLACLPSRSGTAQVLRSEAMPDCASNASCYRLYKQAQQQLGANRLADSLHSFRLAYNAVPDPRLHYSIARLLQLQKACDEAIPHYRQFIESQLDDDEQKTKARDHAAECERSIAEALAKRTGQTPLPPAPPLALAVPIYKKGWFWVAVGGSTATLVIGLGVGLSFIEQPYHKITW